MNTRYFFNLLSYIANESKEKNGNIVKTEKALTRRFDGASAAYQTLKKKEEHSNEYHVVLISNGGACSACSGLGGSVYISKSPEPKVIPAGVHPNCKCVLVPLDIAKVMYDNSSGTANKGPAFEQMTPELKEYEAQCDKEWKESSFALNSNIDNAIAYIKMSKSDIKQLPEGILQKLRLKYDDELAKAEIWAYAYYGGGGSMEVFLNRVSYVLTAGGSDFLAKHLNPYSFKRIELLKSNHRTAAFFGDLAGLSYIFAISGALADKAEDKGNKYSGESYNGARNPSVDFNNAKGNSTAQSHFDRHRAGFNSVDDYVSGSRNFLEKPPTSTTQSFVSSDGTYFRYDTATNEFGIMNKHGGVSTYFRPETGLNYWLEQISKYAPK